MRSYRLLLLSAALGWGQAPAVLEGRVVDVSTGVPVAGVIVTAGELSSKPTKADGRFALDDPPFGRVMLFPKKTGYVPVDTIAGTAVTLFAGIPPEFVTVRVAPPSTIQGRVEDAQRNPLAGFTVGLMRRLGIDGGQGRIEISLFPVQTDDQGEYRLKDVPPGEYLLRAVAPRENLTFVDGFYPNSDTLAGAGVLRVSAGVDLTGLTIRLSPARIFKVSGRVIGLAPPPAQAVANSRPPNWFIDLQRLEDVGSNTPISSVGFFQTALGARVNAAGEFAFERVPAGAYRATLKNGLSSSGSAISLYISNRDLEDVRVFATPGIRLRGKVLKPPADKLQLGIIGENGDYAIAVVSPDGSFEANDLRQSGYRIVFMPDSGQAIETLSLNGKTTAGSILDLTNVAGIGETNLEIAFGPGAVMAGTVEDPNFRGGPFSGSVSSLLLLPNGSPEPTSLRTVEISKDRTFSILGLSAGTYRVCAWKEGSAVVRNVIGQFDLRAEMERACSKTPVKNGESPTLRLRQMSIPTRR